MTPKQRSGLRLTEDAFLLVNDRGTPFSSWNCTTLFKRLKDFCQLKVPAGRKFTPYSIRVGATSMAHCQEIDGIKMMRYVLWHVSSKSSPTMHAHYVQLTLPQIATVANEMLHGVIRPGGERVNNWQQEMEVFDVNATSIAASIYINPKKSD